MKKYEPISNSDIVIAHMDSGVKEYRFGQLKSDFLAKKIIEPISKIYHPRSNQYFKCTYQPTKGFSYKKIN